MANTDIVDSTGSVRSAGLLAQALKDKDTLASVANDPSKVDDLAKNAIEAANKASGQFDFRQAFEADRKVYRYVVWFIGISLVLIVVGIIGITVTNAINKSSVAIPDSLVAIASAAIGALAGLLSPIATNRAS